MNPYTVARKVLLVIGHVFKWLVILTTLFLAGVIGVALTGEGWGWVLGPIGAMAACILILLVVYAGVHLPFWWSEKERLYRERQRTAHGGSNPVTN